MLKKKAAIAEINKAGILLVFPINNRKEPASLWSRTFPKKKMKWDWNKDGDDRVAQLWHLKTELSTTRKVVYTKWYQGRATYLSRSLFPLFLHQLNAHDRSLQRLSFQAKRILEILSHNSPISTKELKTEAGLKGRENESTYHKALQELWKRLLIVAFGEVDDGAFPSIAIGATQVLFEDLWSDAFQLDSSQVENRLSKFMDPTNLFYRNLKKIQIQLDSHNSKLSNTAEPASKIGKSRSPTSKVVRYEDL